MGLVESGKWFSVGAITNRQLGGSMIKLTKEKESLLVPLYGKAMDYNKHNSILRDAKAAAIVKDIDYDFASLKIQDKTNVMMTIRAKLIDDYSDQFLAYNQDVMVLHLGCGLDSRVLRLDHEAAKWYDVDFEEVIELRKLFYEENFTRRMVASSVTESQWIEAMKMPSDQCLVIAEGLFMYLKEDEIKTLLERLKDKLGAYTLVFDAYSKATAKRAGKHPSLKATGAVIKWGIDNPVELTTLVEGAAYKHTSYFTKNDYVGGLAFGSRILYGIAHSFKAAREGHRIMVFDIK